MLFVRVYQINVFTFIPAEFSEGKLHRAVEQKNINQQINFNK